MRERYSRNGQNKRELRFPLKQPRRTAVKAQGSHALRPSADQCMREHQTEASFVCEPEHQSLPHVSKLSARIVTFSVAFSMAYYLPRKTLKQDVMRQYEYRFHQANDVSVNECNYRILCMSGKAFRSY